MITAQFVHDLVIAGVAVVLGLLAGPGVTFVFRDAPSLREARKVLSRSKELALARVMSVENESSFDVRRQEIALLHLQIPSGPDARDHDDEALASAVFHYRECGALLHRKDPWAPWTMRSRADRLDSHREAFLKAVHSLDESASLMTQAKGMQETPGGIAVPIDVIRQQRLIRDMKSDIDAVSARIRILQSRGFCVTDLRDVHDGIAATIDAYLSAGGSPREGWDSALHTRIADLEALVAKSEYLADRVDQVADSLPKMQEAIRRVESLKGKHATSGLLRSVTAGVTSAMASRDVTPVDAVYRAVQAQADTVVAFTSPVRR